MRRALLIAVAAVLALTATAAAKPKPAVPERGLVRGAEFDLTLSKQQLKPGRAIVQFFNDGEDPHDLKLQRIGDAGAPEGAELSIGVVGTGAYENIDTRLEQRTTYRLWCSLSDLAKLDMEATLQTGAKKKKKKRRRAPRRRPDRGATKGTPRRATPTPWGRL